MQNAEHLNHESSEPPASSNEGGNSSKWKDFFSPKQTNEKPKLKEDPRLTRAYNILESVSNVPRDECSTFGEHLVSKLRKFNEQRRSILMHRINNLVFEAEMELYSHQECDQYRNIHYNYSPSIPSSSSVVSAQCSPTILDYDSQPQVAQSSHQEESHRPSSCHTLLDFVTNFTV